MTGARLSRPIASPAVSPQLSQTTIWVGMRAGEPDLLRVVPPRVDYPDADEWKAGNPKTRFKPTLGERVSSPRPSQQLVRSPSDSALLEIEEQVEDTSFLRGLVGEFNEELRAIVGGALAVGAVRMTDIPVLVAAGAAVAQPVIRSAWNKHVRPEQIERNKPYFLYRTGQLLADRATQW